MKPQSWALGILIACAGHAVVAEEPPARELAASVSGGEHGQRPERRNRSATMPIAPWALTPMASGSTTPVYADVPWYPYAVAPPFGVVADPDDPAVVYAGSARIDTRPGATPPAIPSALAIAEPLGSRAAYYIVHFRGIIETSWKRDAIAAGAISTESYLPHNALVFFLTPEAFDAVRRLEPVDWVGYYHPAYTLCPTIGKLREVEGAAITGRSRFVASLFPGVVPERAAEELASRGLDVLDDIAAIRSEENAPPSWLPWRLTVEGHYSQVPEIALVSGVQYVEEAATVAEAQDWSAAGILQSGSSAPWAALGSNDPPGPTGADPTYFPLWVNRNLRGQGQVIGNAENIDYDNGYFTAPVTPKITPGDYTLKVPKASLRDGATNPCADGATPLPPGTTLPGGYHGTRVAGACCQDWNAGTTFETREPDQAGYGEFGEGIAHEAQIVVGTNLGYAIFSYATQRLQWLDLYGYGASVMNTSWAWCTGAPVPPQYDNQSALLDDVMNTQEKFLITNAAGNKGNCPTFDTNADCQTKNWAKGPIDVGASDDLANFDQMINILSWNGVNTTGNNMGPNWTNPPGAGATSMIFPDVAATGDDSLQSIASYRGVRVATASCGDPFAQSYFLRSTSASSAVVAGAAALVHQYFQEGNFSGITDPTAALVKAMIVNGSEKVGTSCAPSGNRPGGHQGWGRPNLSSVLAFKTLNPTAFNLQAWDVPNASGFSSSGQFTDYPIDIESTALPLKITLVWLDVPSTTGTFKPFLVNNLDLRFTKGAVQYLGNNFDPATGFMVDPPTTGVDAANVVENIFLSAAQVAALGAGPATIRVSMANAPTGRNQGYALVVTGGVAPPTSVFFDRASYTCNSAVTVYAIDSTPSPTVTVTGPGDSETLALSPTGQPDQYTATVTLAVGDATPNNGILGVVHGDTITATYEVTHTDTATIGCMASIAGTGRTISGGCDNAWPAPGHADGVRTDAFSSYMDDGELVTYQQQIQNTGATALTDVRVALTKSGAGASALTIYSANPVNLGRIEAGATASANFSIGITGGAARSPVTLTFAVTSPADGDSTPALVTESEAINADDVAYWKSVCFVHNTADMNPRTFGGYPSIPWAASTSATCGAETRTDGPCGASALGIYKTSPCGSNVPSTAYQALFSPIIQPVNQGPAGNGEPWQWTWRRHSFYAATASATDQSVQWQMGWEKSWGSASGPTSGDAFYSFDVLYPSDLTPQTILVSGTPPWDWDAINQGIPDVGPTFPPDQFRVSLDASHISGASTSTTRWLFAHTAYGGGAAPNQGFGIDDDRFSWDEYYRVDEDYPPCGVGGSPGTVSWDKSVYTGCPDDTALISVLDANATSPVLVTVTSTKGDSEQVTVAGSPPFFSSSLAISTRTGAFANDGTLFTNANDVMTATYNDGSPVSTSTATATHSCPAPTGDVVFRYYALDAANSTGDGDRFADHNEKWRLDITIENDLSTTLQGARVDISTTSPYVDCVTDGTALYGDVAPGAAATNPPGDQFEFHVQPDFICTNPATPAVATISVTITGTNFSGSRSPQSFPIALDLDAACSGNCTTPVTRTENFNANPGWATGLWETGDCDGGCSSITYLNEWGWGAGDGGGATGGYGCPAGTGNYQTFDNGYLQSPPFFLSPTGPYTMSFSHQNDIEATYDAGVVYGSRNGGPWVQLAMAGAGGGGSTDTFTGDPVYCNALCTPTDKVYSRGETAFTTGTVDLATMGARSGDEVRFRWRQTSDDVYGYAGMRIDDFALAGSIGGTFAYVCDTKNNAALPGCCAHSVTVSASSTSVCTGTSVTLTATVTGGTGTITYQWLEDGSFVPGATDSTLIISKQSGQTHSYNVRATRGGCTAKGSAVAVTWNDCFLVKYDPTFDPGTTLAQVCGDGDAYVEPGEIWSVRVRLKNAGTQPVTSVTASLALDAGSAVSATIAGNPGAYGNIPSGGTALTAAPYTFTVSQGASCVNLITFDLIGIASTEGSYPGQSPAFNVSVGYSQAAASETRSQTTSPITATSGTSSSNFGPTAFTMPLPINSATVTYGLSYTPLAGGTTDLFIDDFTLDPAANGWTETGNVVPDTANPDGCVGGGGSYARLDGSAALDTNIARLVDTTCCTNIRLQLDYRYTAMDSGEGIFVQYSTTGLAGPWTTAFSQTSTGNNQTFGWSCAQLVPAGGPFPAAANNNPNFAVRIQNNANNGAGPAETVTVDDLVVRGSSAGSTLTANVKTELIDPVGGVTILKAFGAANATPYTVTSSYIGPGTYQIRLTENGGGTASVFTGSMTVSRNALFQCDVTSCQPPGEAGKSGATTALKARKGAGADDIQVAFGNACNATGHAIYWSTQPFPINDTDWTSAGCAFVDADGDNRTYNVTFNPGPVTSLLWFIVAGHDLAADGTLGKDSAGGERPAPTAAQRCQLQNLSGSCP